ncbi:formylglycine-generating enzyme family protein [Nostoc sp. CCY0012]|uniref:formylglycine-generating enzyme family protein n=1 Tax=Nostoc sp. CCY0012 TaxID=1056123 RepID=UPI0039C66958
MPNIVITKTQKTAKYYVEDLGNGIKLDMVLIPGGSFMMGAPDTEEESRDNERPHHQVTVSTFFIGKYPVTQAQWRAVAALPQVNRKLNPEPSRFQGDKRPVERVSWYDAVEFCSRLAQFTGRPYSLPSEAQWEYACRAGTTTPFHFGETITSELANYNAEYTYSAGAKGKYRRETTEVGSFEVANAFGLCDMHGNVWEWCLDDWHDNYEKAPTDGSSWFNENHNLSQKQARASLRGGSWITTPANCRSAYRPYSDRDDHVNDYGFRLACGLPNMV